MHISPLQYGVYMMNCLRCNKNNQNSKRFVRGYCQKCYHYLRNHGQINNLPVKPLPDKLTTEQEEILIGSLLGDGCIILGKNSKNAILTIRRKLEDKEYLIWEYEKFRDFCSDKAVFEENQLDKRTKKTYKIISFHTRSSPILAEYRKKWYPNGKKIVPRDLVLTPLILLIWFLDDGNAGKNENNVLGMKLSTNGFTKDDTQFLANLLTKRYNCYFGVHKHDNSFVIQASDSATKAFISEIKDIFPNFMSRKIKWNAADLNSPRRKSKKLNPSIDIKILYKELLSFSRNDKITTKLVLDKVFSKMNENDKKYAADYILYFLRKLSKAGYLNMIDLGSKTQKIFYLTNDGIEYFKSQI
jgi:hypothetical protein